jgi:hypothetical protein
LLIFNTISESSNLNICFYHCLIFTLILHLRVLFHSSSSPSSSSLLLLLLLLFIIYIVHLPVVRPRSCRVIYYFDTPALGIRHQLFDRVMIHDNLMKKKSKQIMKSNFQQTQYWMMKLKKNQLKIEQKNNPSQLGLT